MTKRPESLTDVAARTTDRTTFYLHLWEFVDEFRREQRIEMLADEPRRLAGVYPDGEVADAYVAAVAVSLAREVGAAPPAWSWDDSRKLRRPWFAMSGPSLRATLLLESPAPFRERNLFVSANALSRA